jgi:hypothetical protein
MNQFSRLAMQFPAAAVKVKLSGNTNYGDGHDS